MKFSSKIEKCGLSPMRKFAPYANEAAKKGKKLYHLNIGQPDIATPAAYFEAVKNFSQPVLAYAPSDGVPEMIDAVVNYYGKIDAPITNKQVLITTGGSERCRLRSAAFSTKATRSSSPSRSTRTTARSSR